MAAYPTCVTDPLIVIDKEDFDRLRDDERFWCLVALARVVNSFRFCYSAFASTSGNSNSAVRAKRSSFLFICALFTEAQTLVGNMGRYFRDFGTFQELSRAINSQNAQSLLKSTLRPVRNTQVFRLIRQYREAVKVGIASDRTGFSFCNRNNRWRDLLGTRGPVLHVDLPTRARSSGGGIARDHRQPNT